MVQRTRLIYEWATLLHSVGFRKVKTEKLKNGTELSIWERETSNGPVEFWVSDEDKPALLASGTESNKAQWEKFDFVMSFHAGGDWALVEHFINSPDGLLEGPLAEIAQENRSKDLVTELGHSLEDRLTYDPYFRKAYEKAIRDISARKAAEETISGQGSKKLENLAALTAEELKEQTGLIDWNALWADESVERWFVKDLLCEGRGHGCPAESGIGKSLLWAEVGAGLSAGKSVLGYPAQEPIKVLYLDHENTPKGDVKPRLQSMGYKPEELENFYYLSFPNIDSLNTKSGGQSLIELLDFFQPNLVFIDTFSRFVEGDENSSKVAQDFYEYAGRELKRRRIAYLRIDHIGKDASRGARGSSAKVDDLDLIWTMSRTKEENVFVLRNQKARVPVSQTEYAIERCFGPLRHQIRSGISWSALLAAASKHELAIELIANLKAKDPKHSLAQGKVWKELGPICKEKGLSRRELFEALDFYLSEQTGEIQLTEPLNR